MKDNDLALNSQKLDALRDELMKEEEEGGVIRSMDLAKLASDMQQFMEVRFWVVCVCIYVCVYVWRELSCLLFLLFQRVQRPVPTLCPPSLPCSHVIRIHAHTHTQTQDEFGVTAKQQGREWLMTRIPAKLFRDYSPRGALFTVCVCECVCGCGCVDVFYIDFSFPSSTCSHSPGHSLSHLHTHTHTLLDPPHRLRPQAAPPMAFF